MRNAQTAYNEYLESYLDAMRERPGFHEMTKAAIKKELDAALDSFKMFRAELEGMKSACRQLNVDHSRIDKLLL